jgi:hypothetical protein
MSHLSTERLAALVDEAPAAAELAHLASCAECAGERSAYQALARVASASAATIGAPLTTWESLAPALAGDRIIDGGRADARRPAIGRRWHRAWLQAAAAVLLVAGGTVFGRATAARGALAVASQNTADGVAQAADSTVRFRSVDEARAAQLTSQQLYQTATAFIAQFDTTRHTTDSPSAVRARLATLDRVREVVGEGLAEAPYDPVINGYYLTTAGQREAALRQLATAVPVGTRLMSY